MISVIVNEKSGDGEGRTRPAALRDAFAAVGLAPDIHTTAKGHAPDVLARAAIAQGARILVAAGGDGTVAAVAGPASDARLPMAILPLGTFNHFARAHGIPQDLTAAVRLISAADERPVRLGMVNGRVFLNNASVGLYPTILSQREEIYGRYGRSRFAAYWSVLRSLAGRPVVLKLAVTLDGVRRKLRTPLAFVANSAYQLEEFALDGAEALRDGRLVLLTAPNPGRGALARGAWRMARGKPRKGPDFSMDAACTITMDIGKDQLSVACDCERTDMRPPLDIRHADQPLQLMVPKGAA
jgi:diacylglycerol kinase family enzyme